MLWLHGTPGGRRQIAPAGRRAAAELGLRLVCMERPGTGLSTNYRYSCIADVVADVSAVADHLGHERFAVVGLSGGGPYALACGALLPERVSAVGILGGVCPLVGPDAAHGGLVALTERLHPILARLQDPLGLAIRSLLFPVIPAGHPAYRLFTRAMPAGDRAVMADDGIEAMFIDDLVEAMRRGVTAATHDLALFGADWGFRVGDVGVPVRWWHGDADSIVPLSHAELTCARLPDAELHVRSSESHLGGFAASDEVLATVAQYFYELPAAEGS